MAWQHRKPYNITGKEKVFVAVCQANLAPFLLSTLYTKVVYVLFLSAKHNGGASSCIRRPRRLNESSALIGPHASDSLIFVALLALFYRSDIYRITIEQGLHIVYYCMVRGKIRLRSVPFGMILFLHTDRYTLFPVWLLGLLLLLLLV